MTARLTMFFSVFRTNQLYRYSTYSYISLDKSNSWFKLNRMIPNTKKIKHLLIGSVQKLIQSSETTMEIYIDNIKLEDAAREKLLGVVIDSNLSWNLHIDYLIKKLNSRICLLKRAKVYLTFACRKMLYNALIKPILEYCCTVWGNSTVGNLQRVLRLQKRGLPQEPHSLVRNFSSTSPLF